MKHTKQAITNYFSTALYYHDNSTSIMESTIAQYIVVAQNSGWQEEKFATLIAFGLN
jgi:hypothetical protein